MQRRNFFQGSAAVSASHEEVGPLKGDVIEMHIDKLPNLSVRIL